jgi:hypothetical protein
MPDAPGLTYVAIKRFSGYTPNLTSLAKRSRQHRDPVSIVASIARRVNLLWPADTRFTA